VTTEDDFQKKLDENPDDWQTRLVLADFLEEHGDERAAGYRAMVATGRMPFRDRPCWIGSPTMYAPEALPYDWFNLLKVKGKWGNCAPLWGSRAGGPATRRELEDAAAIAFAKLPAERQFELLNLVHQEVTR
jgi:uncharacterized protein (TIGR02996 family)